MRPARVVTIVLNYQQVDDTVRCVRALQKSDFLDQRILVVDNAEEGSTTAALREQLESEVVVLASGDNLGYAGGNNLGIKWALQWHPHFIWLVNPDAVAKPKTLSGLVRAAEANADAGIVGCRMLVGGSQPPRIESNGGLLDAAQWGTAQKRDAGRFDGEVVENGVRDADWVSGACFLIRAALIDEIGMLPEEYFLYFEDTEYCLRAQSAGWRTVVAPGTRMWHFGGSTRDLPSASYVYYLFRNRVHFGVRHFDATVDDLLEVFDRLVQRWRLPIQQHAPELLESYDELVRMALADARAGRFGRAREIESVPFAPNAPTDRTEVIRLTATLDRERKRATGDAKRLLRRIRDDEVEAKKVRELEQTLERERRRRTRLKGELEAMHSSRSFRFGRAVRRLARPASMAFSGLARRRGK